MFIGDKKGWLHFKETQLNSILFIKQIKQSILDHEVIRISLSSRILFFLVKKKKYNPVKIDF
ncbi:hypothetical protein BpHYR1_044946 [Brachionus plicatilis]|uniref:Uncharacterized protein n=1 Tax=Brachionus plicatilis TaxID=10195 RepID=A0A3M7S0D6_BRAPC|nr:hypothetical protein BpHYR1_044946 [Brachionus plicatilis]